MSSVPATLSPSVRPALGSYARRSRGGTRTTVESRETAGYPIVPVGDSIRTNVTEEVDEFGHPTRRIGYPTIGLQIVHSTKLGKSLPSSAILDVYTALLFLFKNAGFPEDGVVYFSNYQLLLLIGWLSTSTGEFGQKVVRPSGRHYRQLKTALKYLASTKLLNDDPVATQIGPDGVVFRGYQEFPVLQYARFVEDRTGPKREGSPVVARSMVQFSAPFIKLLRSETGLIDWDLDLFLSLPAGMPRHLYRLFAWMRHEGKDKITIEEAFQRLGSTQMEFRPARARQILGKAHAELLARGVLAEEPVYRKIDGQYWIEYRFGDPELVLSEEEMLIEQALKYGVALATAREMAIAHRNQFERVLAATTLGMLRPRRTLASMIVHYTMRGREIFDPHRVVSADAQISIDLGTIETEYLAWAASERVQRLQDRPDLDPNVLRAQLESENATRSVPRPDWLIEGLIALRLNSLLEIEGLDAYRRRRMLTSSGAA